MTDARQDIDTDIEVDPADLAADPPAPAPRPSLDDPEVPAADAWEQSQTVAEQEEYRT
jgi:hypothetical protein